MVEFALIMPLLFSLMLGIFTGGLAYNQKLAVVNGVREGSRYGATLPVASAPSCGSGNQLDCWLQQVATITLQASEGELASGVTGRSLCIAYVFPDGTVSVDRTRSLTITGSQAPSGGAFSGSACFADGRPSSERRVQVVGTREGRIDFVFGTSTPELKSQSVTRFEAATGA